VARAHLSSRRPVATPVPPLGVAMLPPAVTIPRSSKPSSRPQAPDDVRSIPGGLLNMHSVFISTPPSITVSVCDGK
jgi:hypothetical protein